MPWYAFLLYPFTLLYDLVTRTRNKFFDLGWKKSVHSPLPSIVIGNLSLGGTGKTPMVEYLIRHLSPTHKVGTLSRGYGRKTKGFLKAGNTSTPKEIGDEPFQIFQKYGAEVNVFVGEDRVGALQKIVSTGSSLELIILDDAFQHRYVKGDFTILLTTFQQPFFQDYILPMGRLRESRTGAKRADLIIVTKCPRNLDDLEKARFQEKTAKYSSLGVPTIFSYISYGIPYALLNQSSFSSKIVLLTGLANDAPLVEYVSANFTLLSTLSYPDHYDYKLEDFEKITQLFNSFKAQNPVLLTTEKDAVKVKSNASKGFLKEIPIFVLPIEARFSTEDHQILDQLINEKVYFKENI